MDINHDPDIPRRAPHQKPRRGLVYRQGAVAASAYCRRTAELVKKPIDLVEYVLVHEMVYLEPIRSERFVALLNQHYPRWREARAELNELPLAAEGWR